MKKKSAFLLLFLLNTIHIFFSSPVLYVPENLELPSKRSFSANTQFVKPFKLKNITIAEYITDPIIMYTSLWGCFALTLPLWETNSESTDWYADDLRGFDKVYDEPYYNDKLNSFIDDTFAERLKLEPFASGRIEPITKRVGYQTVLRTDFFAKNIIEPIYFTYLALYMRAKNYHPAIMITEIILLSFLYELTIRPFYLDASFEQFLKNPGISLVVGIFFDEISNFLLSTPYIGLHVLAYIFNPFNALPNSRIHPMLFFQPYRNKVSIEAVIEF